MKFYWAFNTLWLTYELLLGTKRFQYDERPPSTYQEGVTTNAIL